MKTKIKLGVIGLNRGGDLIEWDFSCMDDVYVAGICDLKDERLKKISDVMAQKNMPVSVITKNYKEILDIPGLDAVLVSTTWDMHFPIAIEAMKKGLYVGLEVGGAYTLSECDELVKVAEQTGHKFMFLENCCYSRREMMALNMASKGMFGELVHLEGAYTHCLRKMIADDDYRINDYLYRNCENYPTHEIGPIAKLLHINKGNRFISLVSMSSKAVGINAYARKSKGSEHKYADTKFAQGDVVTTILKCANGETVTITLDTTLPCPYSRRFAVIGTEGRYNEENDSVFFDGVHDEWEWMKWKAKWGNAAEYQEEYDHPVWQEHRKHPELLEFGHGGTDFVSCRAFVETVKRDCKAPIDVYDAAVMMCISVLSEQSIALGSQPVAFPDFTRGEWLNRKPEKTDFIFSLDY